MTTHSGQWLTTWYRPALIVLQIFIVYLGHLAAIGGRARDGVTCNAWLNGSALRCIFLLPNLGNLKADRHQTLPMFDGDPALYKKAELSQRRPRDAPSIWVLWNIWRVLTMPTATFLEICKELLFRSILRMCVQNLKCAALPVPELIGGTEKIWAVPGYAHIAQLSCFIVDTLSVSYWLFWHFSLHCTLRLFSTVVCIHFISFHLAL